MVSVPTVWFKVGRVSRSIQQPPLLSDGINTNQTQSLWRLAAWGRHSIEVAYAFLTFHLQVRILAGTPDFLTVETSSVLYQKCSLVAMGGNQAKIMSKLVIRVGLLFRHLGNVSIKP